MSKLQKTQDWMARKQPEWAAANPEKAKERVAFIVSKLDGDLSDRAIWHWFHYEMTGGKFPDGSTLPSELNIRADMDAAVAKLETAFGRKATPEEKLNAHFAAQEKAKAAGYVPQKKSGSRTEMLNGISPEELANRFPAVGATTADWHRMSATDRLRYADVLVSERELAAKQSTPTPDRTLSPEERLTQAWSK